MLSSWVHFVIPTAVTEFSFTFLWHFGAVQFLCSETSRSDSEESIEI